MFVNYGKIRFKTTTYKSKWKTVPQLFPLLALYRMENVLRSFFKMMKERPLKISFENITPDTFCFYNLKIRSLHFE